MHEFGPLRVSLIIPLRTADLSSAPYMAEAVRTDYIDLLKQVPSMKLLS